MRYTVSLRMSNPHLLFRYKLGGTWSWTEIYERVQWLTLEEAKQFVESKREYAATYIIMDEDQVRSLLVANELAKHDAEP